MKGWWQTKDVRNRESHVGKSSEFTKEVTCLTKFLLPQDVQWVNHSTTALLCRESFIDEEIFEICGTFQLKSSHLPVENSFWKVILFPLSIYTLYFGRYLYLLSLRSSASCLSVIVDINPDNFKQSSTQHVCMWISWEDGSSWECREHANIGSTIVFSDRGRSFYLYLSSEISLIRALKKENGKILLTVAFYWYCANDWQTLLARSSICAQQVHSHDMGLGAKRQPFQCLSPKQYP